VQKEKAAVDTDDQAARAWLLDIQSKLYTWSRDHPGEAWRDIRCEASNVVLGSSVS
jgi:hypothetical protein